MKARILPPDEWGRLEICGLQSIFPDFRSEDVAPIVVEENGEIIRAMIVVRTVHLESVWAKETVRSNAGSARMLMNKAFEVAREWGRIAFAQSCRENVVRLLSRHGAKKLDVQTFILPLEEPIWEH